MGVSVGAASSSWIGPSARFDVGWFFASAWLAAALGAVCLALPAAAPWLFVLWLWLVEGPHLVATWLRTYLDPQLRKQRPLLLAASLFFVLLPPTVLAVAELAHLPELFVALLGFAALWSFHHGVRQHWGVASLYARLDDESGAERRGDFWFLHASLWVAFLLSLLAHPENRAIVGLPREATSSIVAGAVGLGGLLVVAVVGYALWLVVRRRSGRGVRAGLFTLSAVLAVDCFAFFVVEPREPLLPGLAGPEQIFLAATIVGGTLHGLQYFGVVLAANARRVRSGGGGAAARLVDKMPLVGFALAALVCVLYLALNSARGVLPPQAPVASWFSPESLEARLALAVYWGVFFHHYYLDQKIWRPSRTPDVARDLGVRGAA